VVSGVFSVSFTHELTTSSQDGSRREGELPFERRANAEADFLPLPTLQLASRKVKGSNKHSVHGPVPETEIQSVL